MITFKQCHMNNNIIDPTLTEQKCKIYKKLTKVKLISQDFFVKQTVPIQNVASL